MDIVQDPATLRDLYPFLEEGLDAIKDKAPGQVTEIAADIYAAARDGSVTVAVLADGDMPWGWTAFYREPSPGTVTLVSWMTYLRPGAPKQMLEDLLTEMETIAHGMQASKIEFVTGRRAWARRLAPHGYRIGGLILEKEVEHG